jgi:hypothetical protein
VGRAEWREGPDGERLGASRLAEADEVLAPSVRACFDGLQR